MALFLFPHDVWEMILEKLEDSQNILTFFKAYPDLEKEGVLQSTRKLWLFDRVIYFIIPHLTNKSILNLRQVCKKWLKGVDNCLENHSSIRPFNHNHNQIHNPIGITGQYFHTEAMPGYYQLQNHFIGVRLFYQHEHFLSFDMDMDSKQFSKRNPFVGRAIVIDEDDIDYDPLALNFYNEALEFLNKFGEHVWFLKIIYRNDNLKQILEFINSALKLVPSLKCLCLGITHGNTTSDHSSLLNFLKTNPFPTLPHLENLEFDCAVPSIMNPLLESYSEQIRKCKLSYYSWDRKFDKFPNLTEFNLGLVWTIKFLAELLSSLEAPNLRKLEVILAYGNDNGSYIVNEVASILTKFGKLSSLNLDLQNESAKYSWFSGKERENSLPDIKYSKDVTVPSLKSLYLRWRHSPVPVSGSASNYYDNLFECFPNMEYLKIDEEFEEEDEGKKRTEFERKSYYEKISEVKTKLKVVTFRFRINNRPRQVCYTKN